jgi:uncharacterized damage-inducible protein DinB
MLDQSFLQLFLTEFRRRLYDESMVRIEKCLALLNESEVWYRPNDNSNSIGNLILHLCGNAQQYIVAGLGGALDLRHRQSEFDERGPISKAALWQKVVDLKARIEVVLQNLQTTDLERPVLVQGFQETGLSILVHVVEHFSYHTGQITYIVKAAKDLQTNYYAGFDLDSTAQG